MKTFVKHYRLPENVVKLFSIPVPLELVEALSVRYRRGSKDFVPAVRGGYTTYTVQTDGVEVTGVAVCSPEDGFCYATGRQIAKERAEKLLAELNL